MCAALVLLIAGSYVAGCEAAPDGNVIIPGEQCHQLLQAQCRCCGSGETSCTARVDYLVVHANAVTGLTEEDCTRRLGDIGEDEPAWCANEFDTAATIERACQGFPPVEETADASSD
ncbi:MAG: hypothetical protein ACI9OJ_005320 [Myxococcota bacterium]